MAKPDITAARLRELLDYDPATGIFRWKKPICKKWPAGTVAGTVDSRGYLRIKIEGGYYRAHRLAWLHATNELPCGQIDHVNGEKTDNRLGNLRLCTNAENQQNKRCASSRSRAGLLGVATITKKNGSISWRAAIQAGGVLMRLGSFKSPELAHAAYIAAKRRVHPFGTL